MRYFGTALLLTLLICPFHTISAQLSEDGESETFVSTPVRLLKPISEEVLGIAFSTDGKRLYTAGGWDKFPGQLTIWNVADAKVIAKLRGIRSMRALAMAPNGKTLACAEFGGEIKLRDPDTGIEKASVIAHMSGVNGLAFSPDGKLLASAGLDQLVKLWDVDSLTEVKALRGHAGMVLAAAFFHDGQKLVTGAKDATAIVWDVASGKEKMRLRGHAGPIESVAVSPDDKLIATGSWDKKYKVWDAESGKEVAELSAERGLALCVAFTADGTMLATARSSGEIRLWDVKTRQPIGSPGRHPGAVYGMTLSPDGKTLITGGTDKTARFWNIAAMKKGVVSSKPDKNIRTWLPPSKMIDTSELPPILALAHAPTSDLLAVAAANKPVQLRNSLNGDLILTLPETTRGTKSLAFLGNWLATGGDDAIGIWDSADGKEIRTLSGFSGEIVTLAFSGTRKTLAAAAADGTIHRWDHNSGVYLGASLKKDPITALAFSPDGRRLVTGSENGSVRIEETDSKPLNTLKGPVCSLAFSAAGMLAAGDESGTLTLWNAALDKEIFSSKGHAGAVSKVTFSSSGRTLISAGEDDKIIVWDTRTGEKLQSLTASLNTVSSLALDPRSGNLVTGGQDGMLLLWPKATFKQKTLRDLFYFDFRGAKDAPPAFDLRNRWMKPEAEGMRITLPPERPHMNAVELGMKLPNPIMGDFEITATYQLLATETPTGNFGVGVALNINTVRPFPDMARIARVTRAGSREVIAWERGEIEPGKQQQWARGEQPASAMEGRLRLKRTGDILQLLIAEGPDPQRFQVVSQVVFGNEDIKRIALQTTTSQQKLSMDARWIDLRIRTEGAPETVALEPGTINDETPSKGRRTLWLGLGLALALVACAAIALLRGRKRKLAPVSEATEAPVIVQCGKCHKRLKISSRAIGRKIKCPACDNTFLASNV